MRVTFRVDASPAIGGGHVMRCLTLADFIAHSGGRCHFVCGEITSAMADRVQGQGHDLTRIPSLAPPHDPDVPWDFRIMGPDDQHADALASARAIEPSRADWIIVDHYGLDRAWEAAAKAAQGSTVSIMAIDDLANRPHDCDLLLDQTFGRAPDSYQKLTKPPARILAGAKFALLRPEFVAWRSIALKRRERMTQARHLLISLGGTDVGGITARVLEEALLADYPFAIDVVIGRDAPSLSAVRTIGAEREDVRVHVDVAEMAPLMARADMAIGAAGGTSWERCCLGLPTLAISLAANQSYIAEQLDHAGAHRLAPSAGGSAFRQALTGLARDGVALKRMSALAAGVTDGQGCERVYAVLRAREKERRI